MACPSVQNFSTLSKKGTIFEKKFILYKFYLIDYSIIRIGTKYDKKMYVSLHVKYRLFLSYFNETRIFSTDFRKILISNFMKIRPMEAEFHADRRTDMTKLIVSFRNFANAPKKIEFYSCNY